MKLPLIAAAVLAVSVVACKPSSKSETSTTTTTGASTPAAKNALIDLESKMVKGKALGSNASEKKVAHALMEIFAAEGETDWSAIVRVNETSTPRKVVVLVRMDDLRHMQKGDRKEVLDLLAAEIDEAIGPGTELAIGIKGKVFFGAVGTRSAGEETLKKSTGSVVETKPLEDALAKL